MVPTTRGCVSTLTVAVLGATLFLLSSGRCEGADRGITIRVAPGTEGGDGSAIAYQMSPEPWCPGETLPTFLSFTRNAGDLFQGTATVSGAEFVGPCTVTTGSGTCTVQDATTLVWSITADGSGVIGATFGILIPGGAPDEGQICISATYTITPVGGQAGEPITLFLCIDYACRRLAALDPQGKVLLGLALALAAVLALARRPA